jgi:hypothetical protein
VLYTPAAAVNDQVEGRVWAAHIEGRHRTARAVPHKTTAAPAAGTGWPPHRMAKAQYTGWSAQLLLLLAAWVTAEHHIAAWIGKQNVCIFRGICCRVAMLTPTARLQPASLAGHQAEVAC